MSLGQYTSNGYLICLLSLLLAPFSSLSFRVMSKNGSRKRAGTATAARSPPGKKAKKPSSPDRAKKVRKNAQKQRRPTQGVNSNHRGRPMDEETYQVSRASAMRSKINSSAYMVNSRVVVR